MKKSLFLAIALLASSAAWAQVLHRFDVPNVDGYLTLKGELHMHTAFSDASVWPTNRIDEAIMDGLDFIAITDHMDGRLQKNKIKGLLNNDRNTSWKLCADYAKGKDIIVLHGGEVSTGMPPGHFNTHFINDCEPIGQAIDAHKDYFEACQAALKEARKQGAFITWNHPHWCSQAPNETKWYKEHTKLFNAGLFDGIEIFNHFEGYSPEAHHWCIEKNLAIVLGTDSHKPLYTEVDYANGELRPCNFIFAKERSEKGIREALDARRTAIYAQGNVYGTDKTLAPLADAILQVTKVSGNRKSAVVRIYNNSSLTVTLEKNPAGKDLNYSRWIYLAPHTSLNIHVKNVDKTKDMPGDKLVLPFNIANFWVDANVKLRHDIVADMPK